MLPWVPSVLGWFANSPFLWFGLRALARRMSGWKRILFLPRRDLLGRVSPVRPLLDDPSKYAIYGLWITGASWLGQDQELLRRGAIKQIVFPHPDKASGALDIMRLDAPRELPNQGEELRRLTREAQKMGIQTKWFPAFLNMTMTFVNPERDGGYVNVELVLPHMEPSTRPVLRIARRDDEEAFVRLWREYESIFSGGEWPPSLAATPGVGLGPSSPALPPSSIHGPSGPPPSPG